MQLKRILVPIDFFSYSDFAIWRAVDLAKLTGGEIHLLHAYQLPAAIPTHMTLPPGILDQLRDAAQKGVHKRVELVVAQGVKAEGSVVWDTPEHAILEAAQKIPADLIVMGTHGRTGMKHVVLGSVAERTVRLAPCPVLTVKRPASAE